MREWPQNIRRQVELLVVAEALVDEEPIFD